MKKLLFSIILSTSLFGLRAQSVTQATNRYAMKLSANPDGTYSLATPKKYTIDLSQVPDLLVPYTPVPFVSKKDYGSCRTVEYVYKSYPDYELKLAVDLAESATPAPFMVYIHGGGWARGNNDSNRSLSQYLAVQKGIAGVRVSYSLAGQTGADITVTAKDIEDAVRFVRDRAKELNINPDVFGFCGASAGGHLSALGAMTIEGAKLFVGYSGIYDLTTAAITVKAKDPVRVAYFKDLSPAVLRKYSPAYLIPRKNIPAALIVCGTGDSVVEYGQSVEFAAALKKRGGKVDLEVYPYYDHNLSSKSSDKAGDIFRLTVQFISDRLK